ncbi:AMP-binding protein [Streptomyces xanthii]|uniref:AMP-binding protein n=1 Tax=Streptomyces xanthii TaxID=2768069 RepID=A0A7H1BH36_9ACTN|nr:AMP-binding protein [Streptomyces xanthii]QNS08041.1 AMP-binding protein [Streptomyces xanthii]
MSNLATALVEAARRHPQRPAMRVGDSVLPLVELDELSARVAGGLLAHGLRPGDRVGLPEPDEPVFPVLYFGALRAGAVAVVAPRRGVPRMVRPRGAARGARLVFRTTVPETPLHAVTGAEHTEADDTTVVGVGPGFLDQLVFWPQRPSIVHRAGHDLAVVLRSRAGGPDTALTHDALRARTRSAARPLHEVPVVSAAADVLHATVRTGACLFGEPVGAADVPEAGSAG